VIQVTDLPAGSTLFPSSADPKCFNTSVDATYVNNGFDQANTDLLVFIDVVNNTGSTFVAQAGACVNLKWPLYGMCRYNVHYVDTDLTKYGTFHGNIMTSIH